MPTAERTANDDISTALARLILAAQTVCKEHYSADPRGASAASMAFLRFSVADMDLRQDRASCLLS